MHSSPKDRSFSSRSGFMQLAGVCLTALFLTGAAAANNFYVSPAGSSSGNGSIASPWDLATGLSNSVVHPGDTVWLRGGLYGSGGAFYSRLNGTASLPIYVRQYPGERATINGGLGLLGNYTWFWGFEIEVLNWNRTLSDPGSSPPGIPANAIFLGQGSTGCKMINMILHDAAGGIADQQEGTATESYGNLVYNNGWNAPDRGHGHNFYVQNAGTVPKIITNNITFNAFDIGFQAYGVNGIVAHFLLDGNVAFNSGLPVGHRVDNVIFEGGVLQQDIHVTNGFFYNPLDAAPVNTGYNQFVGPGVDLTLQNNYFVGASPTNYWTLQMTGYQSLVFKGNTVVGPILPGSNIPTNTWTGNTYYNSAPPPGVDPASTVINHNPSGVQTFVQPNKYEPGRAHIIVFNWDKNPGVTVDISASGLPVGAQYEVRDSQNFWGTPVLAGTYDGKPIALPMNLTQVSQMTGGYPTPPHTSAEFNAFILLPKGTVAQPPAPKPAAAINLSASSLTFSGVAGGASPSPQNITLSNNGASNTTLNWTASSNQSWLSVAPGSGQYAQSAGGTLGIYVSTTGLAAGTYQGAVTISDPNALNNPQAVIVTLNLTAPPPPPPPGGTAFLTGESLGKVRNDFSGWVGMRFVVGPNPITVAYLARLVLPGSAHSHTVKLVNAATLVDIPGASVTIPAGGTPGFFSYVALSTPVVLAANGAYIVASQEVAGQDQWYDMNTSVQSTADGSVQQAAYFDVAWHTINAGPHTYGPSNFAYTLGGTIPAPPPPPPIPPSPPPTSGGTALVTGQVLGTLRNNYSGWVGLQFRVGSNPLTVTGLGRIAAPGNTGTHMVKLVTASNGQDVAGASAAVSTSGAAVGTYVYGAVTAVVLSPNTAYYILSQESAGGDLWYDYNTLVQTANVASPLSSVYSAGSSYITPGGVGMSYGPLNLQYSVGGSTAPPAAPPINTGSGGTSTSAAAAVFQKIDSSTMGYWKGAYGADGRAIEGDAIQYPAYAQVAISGAQTWTWQSSTGDLRALQKATNPSDRIAAAWYSATGFSLNVNLTDGLTHEISLYAMDWDNFPRLERIDVLDAASQAVLDSRVVSDFRLGKYLVWNAQGHVIFRVTNLGPGNAVVSGIFFGGK